MSRVNHVLLTGGVGSRLWPLSRLSRPKQYLELFSNKSLFELAVTRNAGICDSLIVVGNRGNKELSEMILARMKTGPYINISEAVPRNTAPAIAFAAFCSDPEDVLLVTPADHIIEEGRAYDSAVVKAIKLARENYLVTFGVKPDKPETGYGYIEHEKENVLSFREKPEKEQAERFLSQGTFLWNSGMFCFKAGIYLEELRNYHPEIHDRSMKAWEASRCGNLELSTSLEIPSLSIDYAVMEKSPHIKVINAEFRWSDMGSFESIYDYLKEQGHVTDGNHNMQMGDTKPAFFVGVNNCILISTHNANLVVSKEASQDVKAIYQYLEKNNPELLQ